MDRHNIVEDSNPNVKKVQVVLKTIGSARPSRLLVPSSIKLKRLEEQCELKNHKIQECQQKIEESWFIAKKEAAKSKAAKEVIKALAVRLHTISGKENTGQKGKVGIHDCMSNLAPIHIDMNSPRDGNMDIWHNTLLGTLENCRVLFICLVALLLILYLFIYLFIVS
ncbi:hypothetical protein Ahy_B06g083117 [Arachis hypogaea]|uniref:Uncharacterized protein n=1 Tax=Arachis hypogaea TaxID=3818 RepID=A0A444YPG9_ARAHY|nr:hypothetical protein Ahy_B06g083117 [Arachis hypogaea]